MRKALKPTTGSPIGSDLKQPRGYADLELDTRVTRPPLPVDIQAKPNVAPRIGKRNPTHINFMFAFGKQTFEGQVPYGPLGAVSPGRFSGEGTRDFIKRLGGNYRR